MVVLLKENWIRPHYILILRRDMNIYSFAPSMSILWLGKFSKYLPIAHFLLGSGAVVRKLSFGSTSGPQPGFRVLLPFVPCCGSFLRANSSACFLWNTMYLFLLLYSSCHYPWLDYHPFIIACQNPIHLSTGREADADCFLGAQHFWVLPYWFSAVCTMLVIDWLAPFNWLGKHRKVTCLNSQLQSGKLAMGYLIQISRNRQARDL